MVPASSSTAYSRAGLKCSRNELQVVVAEDRRQGGAGLLAVEYLADAADVGVPLRQHLIDPAPLGHLVLDLAVLVVPVVPHLAAPAAVALLGVAGRVRLQDAAVGQVDLLLVVLAVEQVPVGPRLAAREQPPVLGRGVGLAEVLGHLRTRRQRRQVEAVEPGVGPEQLHVQGMVLASLQHAVAVRVPAVGIALGPGERDVLLERLPVAAQPLRVAADLPLPVGLDHAAELAVGAGPEAEPLASQRQLQAEGHAAVGAGVVAEVGVAHRALQVGEQERHRVGVVPHVGAAPLAAALVDAHPLEAVEGAVLQPQHGGAVEHRQGGRGGVEHGGRRAAGVQRVAERQGVALQPLPLAQAVAGAGRGVGEAGGVPVAPLAGLELRRRRIALFLLHPHRVPVVDAVGEAPGQHEAHAAGLPGGHA